MKRFLLLLALVTGFCQASGVFESRALTFKGIDQKIIFQKTKEAETLPEKSPEDFVLKPSKTIIFIDLDDTFLNHDGRDTDTQKLKHPDNLLYIKKWKDAGFTLAFLTSRGEFERGMTVDNLQSVGVKEEWNIPLFIVGSGNKKGEWLADKQIEFLKQYTNIIHIDDKKHQLESLKGTVCPGHVCYLVHFDQMPNVELGDSSIPSDIKRFTQKQTTSVGNKATFILSDKEGPKFVLKKGDNRIEQFKEEVLADALYEGIASSERDFVIRVPKFKVVVKDGVYSRISEFLSGKELGIDQQAVVAKGFVVDAFMANWDLVVGGKNLWLSNNSIYRMDNGGSLRYRAVVHK